jgi:hypothetical protein
LRLLPPDEELAGVQSVASRHRRGRDHGIEGRYHVFQLAEVAVPRALFAAILRRIDRLRGPPSATA